MVGQVNFLGFLIKIFPFVIELDLCNDTSPGNLIAPQVEQRFMLNWKLKGPPYWWEKQSLSPAWLEDPRSWRTTGNTRAKRWEPFCTNRAVSTNVCSGCELFLFFFAWQANRGTKTVRENKKDQEILYTLTIPQASVKDSGSYSCSIVDIANNEIQTKEQEIQVFGTCYGFLILCLWVFVFQEVIKFY